MSATEPSFLAFEALSPDAMQQLAERFAALLKPGDTVALQGEVGAGKTTFARSLIGAIAQGAQQVTSPTFNLMQSYDVTLAGKAAQLWHLDLYRIENVREVDALGLEELWPQLVLVEWPERIEGLLPMDHLRITLTFAQGGRTRAVRFYGNDTWRKRLESLGLPA